MGASAGGIGTTTANPNFNVNTAASQGLQGAMNTTAAGIGFNAANAANAYANPFQKNVIGGLQQAAGQNYQMMNNALGAEASRAGAFGGSRHGVAQGQMAADVQRDLNQQIGNLQYQGYGDAMSRAAQDQQMRMSASNQLANQANLGFGMGQDINKTQMVQGAMQQALQQLALDKASQQYQGFTQSPYTSLTALTTALGGTPMGRTTTTSGTTNRTTSGGQYNAGLLDYLGMGLTAYNMIP
jgi:hypothetical protein